jgi:F-type H+-transporting ATPase subunit b
MTSWLLLATADAVNGVASGAPEGGLFDLDATLPLMAVQVVLLTFILNALFFRPVGRAVEEREGYVATSRADAKQKLAQAQRLEADLTDQLKEARQEAQKLIVEAEQQSDRLYRDALATAQAESIAVREKDVIAVEAVEGTDRMIERAGELCRRKGWTLLKTARPGHDMRADVPTIGVSTVEKMHAAGGGCIAVGVGRVILVDKPAVLAAADRLGVAIVGVHDA